MKKKMIPGVLALGMAVAMLGNSVLAEPDTKSSEAVFELISGGDVAINSVPDFNFGEQQISTESKIYADESTTPSVQITDLRGTGQGWNLALSATAFMTDEDQQLMGAILRIKAIEIGNPNENVSTPPTGIAKPIEFGEGENNGNDVSHVILNAETDTGSGVWLGNFYDDIENQVELEVPAGNTVGEYTSTLTWTLSDAPQ